MAKGKSKWGMTADDLRRLADDIAAGGPKVDPPKDDIVGDGFILVEGESERRIDTGQLMDEVEKRTTSPILNERVYAIIQLAILRVARELSAGFRPAFQKWLEGDRSPATIKSMGDAAITLRKALDGTASMAGTLCGMYPPDSHVQHMLSEYFYMEFSNVRKQTINVQMVHSRGGLDLDKDVQDALDRLRRSLRDDDGSGKPN